MTYEVSGAAGPVNDKVGHIPNEVGRQSQIEKHVKDIKQHLPWVLRVQISVTSSS